MGDVRDYGLGFKDSQEFRDSQQLGVPLLGVPIRPYGENLKEHGGCHFMEGQAFSLGFWGLGCRVLGSKGGNVKLSA